MVHGGNLNVFYVLQVLFENSDKNHPMTASDIKKVLDKKYERKIVPSKAAEKDGSSVSIDSIKRILLKLVKEVFEPEKSIGSELYQKKFEEYGFYLKILVERTVTDNKGQEKRKRIPYRLNTTVKRGDTYYFYIERELREAEILALKDAIETYQYFSKNNIAEIMRKLLRLSPSLAQKAYYDRSQDRRSNDSALLGNIVTFTEIISSGMCAAVIYGTYSYNSKNQKKFSLSPYHGHEKKGRLIIPVKPIWSNGYYYLLAYHADEEKPTKKAMIAYRMDRFLEIKKSNTEIPKAFKNIDLDIIQYRMEHPVMYSGETANLTILCQNKPYIINSIVDTFGETRRVLPARDEEILQYTKHDAAYYKNKKIDWIKVFLSASLSGAELWLTQYCNDCIVIEPPELREKVKERIEQGQNYYQ